MQTSLKKQEGMMTVEAVLSLVPFIIVVLGIISFINIFVLHNRIQYALYQMGSELSGYTYFYQALGVRSADLALKEDIDTNTQKLDETVSQLESFINQIKNLESADGKELIDTSRELLSDPKAILRGFIYLGIENVEGAAKSFLIECISNGLMQVYLDSSFSEKMAMNADQYLKYFGVRDGMKGLDFGKSELFQDDEYRMIDIVVEYDVEVYILKLFVKDPTIHVVQRCAMPAWLDGDGVSYSE